MHRAGLVRNFPASYHRPGLRPIFFGIKLAGRLDDHSRSVINEAYTRALGLSACPSDRSADLCGRLMQGDFLNPGEHLTNAKGEVLCMSYDKVARHIGVDGREVVSTAFSTRDGGMKEGTPGTCNATHQEMAGTDVGGTTYTGTTDAERDASCCARCEANPACEFWVRATDSSDCWLKKGFGRSSDSASRRGGFRGGVETYDRALRYSDKGTIRVPGKELWGITASKWSNDHYKPGSDKAFHSFLVGNCVELDQVALKRVVQHDYASHGAVTATKTCAAASTCGAPIGCTIHRDHKLASVHPKVDTFSSGLQPSAAGFLPAPLGSTRTPSACATSAPGQTPTPSTKPSGLRQA